jgi:hypothetical protein
MIVVKSSSSGRRGRMFRVGQGYSLWDFPFEPSPRQAAGNLHRKDESLFSVRSLTPPPAARNALAFAVQFGPMRSDRSAACLLPVPSEI